MQRRYTDLTRRREYKERRREGSHKRGINTKETGRNTWYKEGKKYTKGRRIPMSEKEDTGGRVPVSEEDAGDTHERGRYRREDTHE